jgi:ubiquinone/menaquinone biosynthesis C-methylase UbiE
MRFPQKDEVIEFLKAEGLREVKHIELSGGIASIFRGKK